MVYVKPGQLGSRVQGALPQRYAGFANPTGDLNAAASRAVAPLMSSDPRQKHPKLNTNPWSSSYRVKRTPSGSANRKAKKGKKG